MTVDEVGSIFVVDGTVRHWIPPLGTILSQRSDIQKPRRDICETRVKLVDSPASPRPVPALTTVIENVLQITGMSNRQLANLVGTTHPTIASILRGGEPVRVEGLHDAVLGIQSVVQRIWHLAKKDQSLVKLALRATDSDGVNVLQHLRNKSYSRAYLVALDLINQHEGISRSVRRPRRRPSLETVILRDVYDE